MLEATVTNWINHLSSKEVAGEVYPYVGTEKVFLLATILYVISWFIFTSRFEK